MSLDIEKCSTGYAALNRVKSSVLQIERPEAATKAGRMSAIRRLCLRRRIVEIQK